MKLKYLIIPVAFFALTHFGCAKQQFYYNDLGGDSTIRGMVALFDTLTGPFAYYGVHPLTVYLRYPSDTTSYLYATITNSLGQYSFNGIDQSRDYIVFASMDSVGLHFYGQQLYPKNMPRNYASDTLKMYPAQTNQNGLFLHVQDSLGQPLSGARVYFFTSRQLWENDDSTGYTYAATSDAFGRVLQLNITAGEYYLHANGQFRGLIVKGSDSVNIMQQGIITDSIKLYTSTAPYGIGFVCFLYDSTGTPLIDVNLYVYTSRVLWRDNDSLGGGTAFVLKSDATGKCIQQGIPAGEYYVTALGQFTNITLAAKDSLPVIADSLYTKNLVLLKQ